MSKVHNRGYRFLEYQLKQIKRFVPLAVRSGAEKTLNELAPDFLDSLAYSEPMFNNYTGNLEESYVAVVFCKGKKKIYYHTVPKDRKSAIEITPNGKRKANIAFRRHKSYQRTGYGTKKRYRLSKVRDYRYLKKWEKSDGYKKRATLGIRRERINARGLTTYMQIRNVAPYAGYVQYGGGKRKHYNVLRGAMLKNFKDNASQMLKIATLNELRNFDKKNGGFGFNVKIG